MASDYFLPNQSPRTMVEEYYSQIRKKPAEQKWRLVSLFTVQSDYYYFLFFGSMILISVIVFVGESGTRGEELL